MTIDKSRMSPGTVVGHGKIVKVGDELADVEIDNHTGPPGTNIEHFDSKGWLRIFGSLKIGDEVDIVISSWSEHFKMNFWGFVPKGWRDPNWA